MSKLPLVLAISSYLSPCLSLSSTRGFRIAHGVRMKDWRRCIAFVPSFPLSQTAIIRARGVGKTCSYRCLVTLPPYFIAWSAKTRPSRVGSAQVYAVDRHDVMSSFATRKPSSLHSILVSSYPCIPISPSISGTNSASASFTSGAPATESSTQPCLIRRFQKVQTILLTTSAPS